MNPACLVTPNDVLAMKDFIAPLCSTITAFLVTFIGYKFAIGQLRHKNAIDIKADLRIRQADALQAAWALLQYLTEVDNGINVIKVERQKRGPGKTRAQEARELQQAEANALAQTDECKYFIHIGNAQAFVFHTLPLQFYEKGAGLLWPREVKELFFTARNIIYGVLLAEQMAEAPSDIKGQLPDLLSLVKPEVGKEIQSLYLSLNELLRKEVQDVYGIS